MTLYDWPRAAAFGRVIPKTKIYEHAGANTGLKDLFVREVDQIVWSHKLAPETVNLAATKQVAEIQVFRITARTATLDRDRIARSRQRIGVVNQDCEFLDHLPIAENIALPLTVSGRDAGKNASNLRELIAWVGLSARASARPAELSGGERQRAALARAIMMDPELILADEPTGNVDWEMSLRLLTLLCELNRLGKTIVIATHDLALIRAAKAQVQARVLRIADGKLSAAGTNL